MVRERFVLSEVVVVGRDVHVDGSMETTHHLIQQCLFRAGVLEVNVEDSIDETVLLVDGFPH